MKKIGTSVLKKKTFQKPTPTTQMKEPEGYTIRFNYPNGKTEKVHVIAENYERALNEGFEEREMTDLEPKSIDLIDPSLRQTVKFIVKEAGKFAAKGLVEVGKGMERIGKYALTPKQETKVKDLLFDCYSDNKKVKRTARKQLKEKFPLIYDKCSFSRT